MSLDAWGDGGESDYITSAESSRQSDEAFVAGLQAMREMLARFIEQGGHPSIAISIRRNWRPDWGEDPGAPSKIKIHWAD